MEPGRRALLLVLGCLMLSGCAASVRDATTMEYLEPELPAAAFREQGFALLPSLASPDEDLIHDLVVELALRMHIVRPDLGMRLPDEVEERIFRFHLEGAISEAFHAWRGDGGNLENAMGEISTVLEVRYLMFVPRARILDHVATSGASVDQASGARYEVLAVVWDAREERVVWAANGSAVADRPGRADSLPGPQEFIRVAADGLVKRLPS